MANMCFLQKKTFLKQHAIFSFCFFLHISDGCCLSNFPSIVKPLYNDYTWGPKIVLAVDRWTLFRDVLCIKSILQDLQMVVVIDKWSLAQVWA